MNQVAPNQRNEIAQVPVVEPAHVSVAQPTPKMTSRWEVVNGKLVCKWFNTPD
ncbi:MAG: hypothetical protein IGS48_19105 [Oscillatoriales cyanobacterium C42_A2020_001]|nr:hypothetical protein [Leptolyngbyaceae cyanobacterium C42_A2020_001]